MLVETFRGVEGPFIIRGRAELHVGGRSPVVEDIPPSEGSYGVLRELLFKDPIGVNDASRAVDHDDDVNLWRTQERDNKNEKSLVALALRANNQSCVSLSKAGT